mmetsp:Transcript_29600/g.70525  ORF Transcript_29600/g.70525 Transcript_29600/m.70525 type:complete len:588 (-) Transcript_29600:171-1934(-)
MDNSDEDRWTKLARDARERVRTKRWQEKRDKIEELKGKIGKLFHGALGAAVSGGHYAGLVVSTAWNESAVASPAKEEPSVAVVGGGIRGLSAAYVLKRSGCKVTVFAPEMRFADTCSIQQEGFTWERGQLGMEAPSRLVYMLIKDLGLEEAVAPSRCSTGYVDAAGRPPTLPCSARPASEIPGRTAQLCSLPRLLSALPRMSDGGLLHEEAEEEALARLRRVAACSGLLPSRHRPGFGSGRIGIAARRLRRWSAALLAAVRTRSAPSPSHSPLQRALGCLAARWQGQNPEARARVRLPLLLEQALEPPRGSEASPRWFSLAGGLQAFPEALSRGIGEQNVLEQTRVLELSSRAEPSEAEPPWEVVMRTPRGTRETHGTRFHAVVLPGDPSVLSGIRVRTGSAAEGLVQGSLPEAAQRRQHHSSAVALGYLTSDIPRGALERRHPIASLVPLGSGATKGSALVQFTSSVFPGTAPEGFSLVTVVLDEGLSARGRYTRLEAARLAVARAVGISASPVMSQHSQRSIEEGVAQQQLALHAVGAAQGHPGIIIDAQGAHTGEGDALGDSIDGGCRLGIEVLRRLGKAEAVV